MKTKIIPTFRLLSTPLMTTTLAGLLVSNPVLAAQKTSEELAAGGRASIEYQGNGRKEICVLPKETSLASYKGGDRENEVELCSINFIENGKQAQMGNLKSSDSSPTEKPLANTFFVTCPKLNSTNPGVLAVHKPEDWTAQEAQQAFCRKTSNISDSASEHYDVEAKFKQSITCSYAPSALAAYHVSRMLGNINKTPVAVVRTMDADAHESIVDKALSLLSGNTAEVIYKTWKQFSGSHGSRKEPKIFADGGDSLYGGLSKNVKKEYIYTEVSGVGPYDTRYERFMQQKPFKRVADSDDVVDIAGGETHISKLLPVIQQMRDVSDMILLDTLLSQDDRIGNIHFYLGKAVFENENGKIKLKKEKLNKEEIDLVTDALPVRVSRADEGELAEASAKLSAQLGGGTLIRMMVLKDNDCGVDVDKRSNMMRMHDGIEQVRHMNPTTYKKLMQLAKSENADLLEEFFLNTLLYRPIDFADHKKSFMANLDRAVSVLKENCESGDLKLDLTDEFNPQTGQWIPQPKPSCDP